MSIQARLAKYPVPDSVWDEYHIDQEINERGVALDMELVQQAIQMDGRSRTELTQAMKTAVCAGGHARGMLQFYGANRTGRECQ